MRRRIQRIGGRFVIACGLLLVGLTVGACGSPVPAGDPSVASGSDLPAGYLLRLDRSNRDAAEFIASVEDGVLRVRTGPAGIIYRPDQLVDAPRYTVQARFTEVGAPVGHREGFGLFIGGQHLDRDPQQYTYFLIRGDGRYLIKHRDGESTVELTDGWESSAAVHLPTSESQDVANDLAIAVDGERVYFSCNDEVIADLPIGSVSTQGVVGVRVNHNLEVRVEDLRVDRR